MFVKHFLKSSSGQSVVEYLVFFSVIAVLTLVSLCTLYPSVHQACESALEDAVEDIY